MLLTSMQFFFPSQSFREMIASCLVKDPSKRPSAKKLLKRSFFKKARSNDYVARTLLEGLPPLGDRMKELKVCCHSTIRFIIPFFLRTYMFHLDDNIASVFLWKQKPFLNCREKKKKC